MHIFTYGSLMYPEVWSRVVRANYQSAPARIHGFQRRKVRGETYPCLIPGRGTVEGRLYFDINRQDLERLDRFEGSQYDRVPRFCDLTRGYVPAAVYVWKREFRSQVISAPWHPRDFERDGLRRFLATYGGFGRV